MLIGAPPIAGRRRIDRLVATSTPSTPRPPSTGGPEAPTSSTPTPGGSPSPAPTAAGPKTMPCLPFETAAMGCSSGRIVVRAPDHAHFCPTSDDPCSVWSSGAWRYASAINDAAVFRDHGPRPATSTGPSGGSTRSTSPAGRSTPTTTPRRRPCTSTSTGSATCSPPTWCAPTSSARSRWPDPPTASRPRCPPPVASTTCAPTPSTSAPAGSTAASAASTVTVRDASPFGNLEAAAGVPGGVSVGGWAIDPDTPGPIAGARLRRRRRCGPDRRRLAARRRCRLPRYGPAHGFGSAADRGRRPDATRSAPTASTSAPAAQLAARLSHGHRARHLADRLPRRASPA